MLELSCARQVLENPLLLSQILSNLRYDHLKDSRYINKLWKFEATKLFRQKTRVCVNEFNLEVMLYATTILGRSLHIRWSPFLTLGLKTLLQKYSRYILSLSWFVDSSGALRVPGQSLVVHWEIAQLPFSSLKEFYMIISSAEESPSMELIKTILHNSPELESFSLEVHDKTFNVSKIIELIVSQQFKKLTALHFGLSVSLSFNDLDIIKGLPRLTSFIWEGSMSNDLLKDEDDDRKQNLINGKWLYALKTLTINATHKISFPLRVLPMTKLSIRTAGITTIVPLLNQFPQLQDLSFSLIFNWERWIPQNMGQHLNIRTLKFMTKNKLSIEAKTCLLRLFAKLPNLTTLSCPADDQFLQQICSQVPQLKKLVLNGNCTDAGVTGILASDVPEIVKHMVYGSFPSNHDFIQEYRKQPNICDLKALEELTLLHTEITDLSVTWAIVRMPNLKKVFITGVSLSAILELLGRPNLRELGVPQPLEGKISYEDIALLQSSNTNAKIIAGWDWNEFPSCNQS